MSRTFIDRLKAPAVPLVRWLRRRAYASRYRMRLSDLQGPGSRDITPTFGIDPGASSDALWQRIAAALPPRIHRMDVHLAHPPLLDAIRSHWQRYASVYEGVGREKALEHALTFSLLDFTRVERYCDVAAATSPISFPLADDWTAVEPWRQDLLFDTDLTKRVVGGFAQSMDAIQAGFFDALTLHCSLEHFEDSSDIEFVQEVDRVLSPRGACLILPLYVADTHRVYFDPTTVSSDAVDRYDDGDLFAVYGYHQQHGRFHSPESLATRLLHDVPSTLEATIIRFHDQTTIDPDIYLRFALVLHRTASIFRADIA